MPTHVCWGSVRLLRISNRDIKSTLCAHSWSLTTLTMYPSSDIRSHLLHKFDVLTLQAMTVQISMHIPDKEADNIAIFAQKFKSAGPDAGVLGPQQLNLWERWSYNAWWRLEKVRHIDFTMVVSLLTCIRPLQNKYKAWFALAHYLALCLPFCITLAKVKCNLYASDLQNVFQS